MSTNNIYTFGDGFAVGHLWPEWPQILQVILYNYKVINTAGIGAGNEFIFSNLVSSMSKDPNATYVVQWAMPDRFDKLIEDNSWDQTIKFDSTYSDNIALTNDQSWWLSSASDSDVIKQYHNFYVQSKQSELRSFNYIWSAGQLLKNKSHCFFGTYDFNYMSYYQKSLCLDFNWAFWKPWFGMQRYSISKYFRDTPQPRHNEHQPSPIVHLEWLKRYVLPKINVTIDSNWLDTITQRMYNQTWISYDPNRETIWNKIKER